MTKNTFLSLSLFGASLPQAFSAHAPSSSRPYSLRVEYAENPLGIDAAPPRFSWAVPDVQRNTFKSAFKHKLMQEPDAKGRREAVVWDGGKVAFNQSVNVAYAGPRLDSMNRYRWTVQTWDDHAHASGESAPQWFETTILDGKGWEAEWIGDTRRQPSTDEGRCGEIPTYARGHYDTVRGRVEVDWREEGESFLLGVTVPAKCLATIELPAEAFENPLVLESGERVFFRGAAVEKVGLTLVESDGSNLAFEVGSGLHCFEVAQAMESAAGFYTPQTRWALASPLDPCAVAPR